MNHYGCQYCSNLGTSLNLLALSNYYFLTSNICNLNPNAWEYQSATLDCIYHTVRVALLVVILYHNDRNSMKLQSELD